MTTKKLENTPIVAREASLVRIPRRDVEQRPELAGTVHYMYCRLDLAEPRFKGRRTAESYAEDWPYPDDKDAEKLWNEPE